MELNLKRTALSAESLSQLPDVSMDRLELITNQLNQSDELENPLLQHGISRKQETPENQSEDEAAPKPPANRQPDDIHEHLEEREAFRTYMLSFPEASRVRFYRRYGSWTGQVSFEDETSATKALEAFDAKRFPYIRIHQNLESRTSLKFTAPGLAKSRLTL